MVARVQTVLGSLLDNLLSSSHYLCNLLEPNFVLLLLRWLPCDVIELLHTYMKSIQTTYIYHGSRMRCWEVKGEIVLPGAQACVLMTVCR